MNKIYLKLIFIKNNKIVEVVFDKRLSFKDNFRLLKAIMPCVDTEGFYIFDKNINVFLDTNEPIKNFNIDNLTTLRVF